MNIDDNEEKETQDEDKSTEDGILVRKHSSIQVSGLYVDADEQVKTNGATSGLQGSGILQVQQQQQQSQGTGVCWERFLHVRTIRVLLVENDNSTRHVVTALLKNCNYEVLDAANGLQACQILEDLTNHIDIVLTEVVMPCLSGIGLLCKIMNHKTRKNIPVIMMSSHDSMGLVFKCLSKGAVDFLVKPIRKNELKNLWQHVWRRCHSSSGSGSESGTQTQKSVKLKGSEKSGNSASGDGENNASNGLNVGDGSDDGSGAQSSWTKQAVEVDSSEALSPMDQVAECPDSTCAQVIRSNAEHSRNKRGQISAAWDGQGQKQLDDTGKRSDLETVVNIYAEPKYDNHVEVQPKAVGRESASRYKLDIDSIATSDCKEPNFELSLKRARGVQDTGRCAQEDRYILRHSVQSAFSRYNTPTNVFKAPNGITGSSSILDNSTEVAKRESVGDLQVYSSNQVVYQSSNGVSNNIDMGSSTDKLLKDKFEATSAINGIRASAFRIVKNDLRHNQQQSGLMPNGIQSTDLCVGSYQELKIQHPHHQNYHHHHPFHMENQPSSNHDESSLKKLAAEAPHCGSTNVLGGPVEGTLRNSSLNRSASGSNHGSNGQNGSSTAVNAIGNNAESDVGQAGKNGSGDASGSGCGSSSGNEKKFAQREAALIKFRQKRKDRCFKKKVRYQNRKKLAEQRPRVRGQFVKQSGPESSSRTGDE
ncbi:cheY-ous receiver domain [Salvia divinorum]|uniref:CheY-ous receiver domain n=1 Tax=Salvia divinorum TaxID=28513 RepID=A0ABD1GZ76_SALDI